MIEAPKRHDETIWKCDRREKEGSAWKGDVKNRKKETIQGRRTRVGNRTGKREWRK